MNNQSQTYPQSSSNFPINLLCLMFFFAAIFLFSRFVQSLGVVFTTAICLLIMLIPLFLYDLLCAKVNTRASTELNEAVARPDKGRLLIKLIGLYGTFLIILFLYKIIPIYHETPRVTVFYGYFFQLLYALIPWIIILSFIYFWWVDPRQKDPWDEYWHMGCLLTGRWKKVRRAYIYEHARVWFIKAFFTPFMFGIVVEYVQYFSSIDWKNFFVSFLVFYNFILDISYFMDAVYGFLGYALTFRFLDNHIRSSEPTILGWLVCLMCYSPFYEFGIGLFHYDTGMYWADWFNANSIFFYVYGAVILFLSLVYGLATVAFGYRMSNLTYRGVVTTGPYRFTKHPAYWCKVLTWWMIQVPFFTMGDPVLAFKCTLSLVAVCLIYYLRAKTEENHLSNYPEYVEYANWMNRHGLLSCVTKYFPGLQYSEEKSKKWKSIVWFKKI